MVYKLVGIYIIWQEEVDDFFCLLIFLEWKKIFVDLFRILRSSCFFGFINRDFLNFKVVIY